MSAPDFVTIGHAVRDLHAQGWRLGGTITFAAVQAHKLGCSVGVVTRTGDDIDVAAELPFAQIAANVSRETTTFENVYEGSGRKQRVRAVGDPIATDDLPAAWRNARIALIGPVFGEVDPSLAQAFSDGTLVGVSAQGWLRSLDAEGNVVRSSWDGPPFWRGATAVFVSDEDLPGGRDDTADWCRDVPIVAMTEASRGLQLWSRGKWERMGAFPSVEVDPTGAGDTFAAAFLIRYAQSGDPRDAARFGAAAASLAVAGSGADAQPVQNEIEERMRTYPEIALH